jgi:hypothetical protein
MPTRAPIGAGSPGQRQLSFGRAEAGAYIAVNFAAVPGFSGVIHYPIPDF